MTGRQAQSARPAATPLTAEQVAVLYERTAEVLDHSASLAEAHARRHQQTGQDQAADEERRAATWAHRAAERARVAAHRARTAARRARDGGGVS